MRVLEGLSGGKSRDLCCSGVQKRCVLEPGLLQLRGEEVGCDWPGDGTKQALQSRGNCGPLSCSISLVIKYPHHKHLRGVALSSLQSQVVIRHSKE